MAGLTFDDLDSSAPLSEDEAQGALNLAAGGAPVTVTSGYRTPEHNAEINGAPNSLHTRGGGQATDFVLPAGKDPAEVRAELERQGYPVTEWLIEKKGDAHSTGDHIHWGWGPKGQTAAQPAASGPVNFSDLDGGANTPTPSKGVSGPVSFDDLEPDPSWGAVLGAQFRTTLDRWKAMAGGVVQAIAESAPTETTVPNVNPFGQGLAEVPQNLTPAQKAQDAQDRAATTAWGRKVYSDAQQHIAETVPQMAPGSVKDYAAKITAGVIDLVPIVAAGMATDNPVIPATLMGGTAAAQTYGAARAAGRTPQQAGMDATFTGMVNGTLGALPIGVLMKPGQTFLGKVLQSAGSFGAFSVVTEALQIGYDKGLVTPNMTLAQAWQRLKDAGITGTLTGAFLGAGHGGLEAAVGRYHVTGPQKPVQPRVEPTTSPSPAAPNVAPIPRPAARRADLLAKAAIPPPEPKEPAAASTGPAEPFFKPEDLEQPTFKAGPAKIAEEHAAEVSNIETEGTKAAGEKHTPEVLKPGYEPEAPAEEPIRTGGLFKKKPKPEPEEAPPPPPENPYVVKDREVGAKYGLPEKPDTEDRAAMVTYNHAVNDALEKATDPEEQDILRRKAGWSYSHVQSIDHAAQMERAEPVMDVSLPKMKGASGRTPIAHINIMFDPESGKYGVATQHDFSGFSGGGGPVSGRQGLGFDFNSAQEALDYAKAQLGNKTDTSHWGTSANKRAYDEAAALGKWLPNVKLPSGEPPEGAPPAPAQGDLFAPIGKNGEGKVLYEDKNGVRSYLDGNVRVNEPVQMRPTRGGVQMVIDHTAHPEFATTEELPSVPAPSLPEPVAEPAPSDHPRALQLADVVAQALGSSQKPITARDLQNMAETVYGGTLASGAVPREEMYDAAELGVNRYLRQFPSDGGHGPFSPVVDEGNAIARAGFIAALKDRLPTQTVRAGEKETMQQFSTPPDYAYAAAWAADLHPSDVVLEPSGGTGSFVTHALNAGVREVHANDLSDRRADMLRSLNPTNVTQENAENIDILLPEGVKPTVVLMNPPFSQTAGRLGTKKTLGIDAVHVEAALKRMQPGGRLVAILGGGTTFNRGFWKRIAANYDIRANIGVEGKIYRKYGTTFPTRLVVIDKNPPSGRPIVELNEVKDAAGIIRALEKVRGERVHLVGEQAAPEPAGPPLAGAREGAGELGAPVPHATGIVGAGEGDRGARPVGAAERPTGPGAPLPGGEGQPVEGAGARVPVAAIEPERPVTEGAGGHVGEPVAGSQEPLGSGGGGAGDGILPDGSGQRVDPGVTEAPILVVATETSLSSPTSEAPLSDAVYEPYTPQRVKITGAKEHPGALVQSAAMASVLPPVPKYNLATPLKVITEGRLSDAQLEAVVYAGHAHSGPFLPASDKLPERRRGFFIGDGTGVGKGREIAGIIQDNWERGTRKHIWVSEKQSLINDAKRDMQGVGLDPKKAFPHNSVKPADAIKASDGVVFTTYDTLKSSEKIKGVNEKGEKVSTKGKTRLQQIIDWVGEDFDGVIAFDEAHNLGNSMDTKANRGVKKAAAKALAGVALQNALPKARVVYVSATGATEVSNLSYAERLGLWGKGTAFANRDDFLSKVSSGGVAAMELVARDMKALGRYIARNLSYDGVEYDRVEHKLTPEQVQVYDKLATGWQLVLKNFNAAMEAAGITEEKEGGGSKTKNKDAKSAILSQFWGGHQRFFNQVITSMQLPTVLKAVERDIAEGRSAVLQLVNTNEAAQERALAKVKAEGDPEEIEDLDMTPRDQLMQLVSNAFPVNRFEDYTDESGNLRSRMVVDKDNKPVQDPKLVAAREALLDELGSIKVPDGPLEMLLNHFGTDKVSEVTGRKQRVVRKPDEKTGQMRTVVEKRPGSANVAEANLFQEGKKPILVFSEAGGTGVSYHADVNSGSANKRRSHYLVQAGWRADKAVQGFGRTHRTNQASAPLFHLVTTDLQGQKRFISSIARRLGQLGALTKGERRTGNQGMFGLRDNLESDEARDALKAFYNDVVDDKIPGVSVTDLQDQMGLKILENDTGRLLQQLPPMPQFLNRMLSLKTDLQNHVFDAFSKRLDDVIDRAAAAGTLDTGVETYTADRIRKVGDQKVYTDQESGAETRHVHLVTETRNRPATTYEQMVSRLRTANASKDAPFIRSKRSGKIFGVADATSHTDKEGRIVEQKKLLGPLSYEFVDSYKLDNEQYWEPVEDAKVEAAWGDQVKKIPEFAQADLHLITGAVLPIWDRLGGSPKIFRLQTDAGERMLGRVIPNDTVPATLKALGAEALKVNVAPAEMATAILDNGKRAELANGWVIKRSLVAGEPRLELVGPDFQFADQLKRDGVFSERIDWKTRFFIPTGEAATVIERVTSGRPVTALSSGAAEKEEGSRFQRRERAESGSEAWRQVTEPHSIGELAQNIFGRELAAAMPLKQMDGGVLTALHHDQVRRAVVANLPVDVVNHLKRAKLSPEQMFSDPDMVVARLSPDHLGAVARSLLDAARRVGASLRAKLLEAQAGRRDVEILPTLKASDLSPREIVSVLAPERIASDRSSGEALHGDVTGAGTEPARVPLAGEHGELDAARLADFLNRHDKTVGGTGDRFQAPTENRIKGNPEQAPGTVRLAHDVVAELPHTVTPQEQRVIDRVTSIARQIVPKAEVVAARNLFPEGDIATPEALARGVGGVTTNGVRRLIAWSLQSPDPASTMRHEAIHWLKGNGFFRPKEWGAMERAAQTGNWIGKHNIMERYPDLGFEGQIEEAIAEQFGKWRRAPAGVPQVVKPLFERLAVLLGRVRDYLRQAFGHDTSADNVFSRIASGEVGNRTPQEMAPGHLTSMSRSVFQQMEPEERDGRIVEGARALINVAEDLQMAIAPMARGGDTTRATVKDFSNLMRAARDFGLFQIDRLKKQFKPSQLKAMWEAADEQSIAAQQNRSPREGGLARLNDQERATVTELQKDAQSVWNAMREAGQIEGEGIPHYVPHLYVEVGETGYRRLGSGKGLRSIPGLGRNVTTTSPHLLHRKYLTAEEGVEAAAHKFGVTATIVKDIRTLPMATMRNREALAGYQLIRTIKDMGQRVGEDWVAEGSTPPGFFHVDHPAFYRWRPAFVTDEASGKVIPAKDQNGNMMWQKVPLSVRADWEGPLRAALTEPEGPVYRAFMDLKMRAMNNIMFSPLVQLHLLTELGRAFPAAPGKFLPSPSSGFIPLKIMFEGNQAKNDQALRLRAVMAGLVPIGHRGAMQDITSVTSADNIQPGRSWTAQILGAVPGLFDVRAGNAVKRGIDRMGDLLHNTLLWDRVQDLQFGLFTTLSDWGRAKGLSQETSDRMAAHMANRYAGTLPRESMSVFARKLSNVLLFSRTYTLGNMGMMKDALGGFLGAPVRVIGRVAGRPDVGKGWGGLPLDIQAQIKRDAPEELAKVQGIARRKAISMLVVDVALMNVGMALVQNFFQWMSGESGDEIAKGYVARWQELEADAARNPFMVLNPIHDMMRLSPVFENERDPDTGLPLQRIFVGYDKQGTAIYARNPLGKYAEEIVGWTESPLVTLKSKLNALAVKPTLDVLANDRGFGRKIYLPTDNAAEIAAKIFAHYVEAALPMQQINATRDLLMGKAKSTDAAQLIGRTVGVTFRRGSPGGPAAGLKWQVEDIARAHQREAMPEITELIKAGNIMEARRRMHALGMPWRLQRYYINTTRNPRLLTSPHYLRDFNSVATPEEKARMQQLRGAGNQ